MPVVEYILIVQKADSFCDSVDAFNRLLRVDSSITINGGKIRQNDNFECDYAITSGEIEGKDQRFFHLKFSHDLTDRNSLDRFTDLLRVVRSIMARMGDQPETLWDDISFHYSRQGYELIHRIENLMRKLIANFMLVTIGKQWVRETSPNEIKDALAKSKRKDYLNVLHTIDFIHLADFLLKPYSKRPVAEILAELRKATTPEQIEAVKEQVPESNWARYFSKLVDCEDAYLQKRWEELYELRCAVAHNAIIKKADLDRISSLVSELQMKLEDAIDKLPQVKVPVEEVQQVAENAASTLSAVMGEFVAAWRDLEGELMNAAARFGWNGRRPMVRDAMNYLRTYGVLEPPQMHRIINIQQIRNHVVHPTDVAVSETEMRAAIDDAQLFQRHLSAAEPPDGGPLSCRPEPPAT
jgi:hypothetical protein